MQTFRSAISDIINDLKSYNLDDRYSFKYLANKLRGKIELFMKQDASNRSLFNINEIWKPLPCIKLIDADYNICSEFYEYCNILKRSVKRIPEVYTGLYGNFIKVLNVINKIEYKQIKSFEYKDIINREYVNKRMKYFWIEDGYLYIPDTTVEEVRALGLFTDSQEADYFNGHCDECYKPLDSVIHAPKYIIDLSKSQVVAELMQGKGIVVDEKPNMNTNQKTNP